MVSRVGKTFLKWRRGLTLVASLLVALVAMQSGIATAIDNDLTDLRAQVQQRPVSGELMLVDIDSRSIAGIGTWPWPRRHYAAMIDRLYAAGARQVAFDTDFSAYSNPVDDRALAEALARAPRPVVLAGARQRASRDSSATITNLPLPIFRKHALVGSFEASRDRDSVLRRQPMYIMAGGVRRPTIGAALAGIDVTHVDPMLIFDLRFDPRTVKHLSAIDVIHGDFDPAAVRGKRVLVGGTAVEIGDRAVLPIWGTLPGVYSLIMGFETLYAGSDIQQLNGLLPLGLVMLVGGFGVFARSRRLAGVIFAGLLLLIVLGGAVVETTAGLRFAVAPALIALFVMLALRGAASIARSFVTGRSTNIVTGLPNALALREDATTNGLTGVAVARISNSAEIAAVLNETSYAELLRRLCERLALIAGDARIFHTGDNMLAWLFPLNAAEELPDRFDALHAIMGSPVRIGGRQIDVQMTYGMCSQQPDAASALRSATIAAEQALQRGLRWHAFSATDQDELSSRMTMIGELESAIDAGQVWVAYQPKYDVATRTIVGAEALVRWLHPERGAIRPDHFIPLAEEHGRIAKLTRHVLDIALGDFATLSTGSHKPTVAINLSATLLSAPNLVEMVCDTLWRHGLLPSQLTLEVTESAAMTSDEAAITALERMRSMGIGISIDDYGTGQSTLAYLKRLPATELKVDQSFVRSITDSRSDEILVNSTIQLGHHLGMKVVAEGVETEAVFRKLEEFGCDIIQGYLIGKPMPFNEFVRGYRNPPRVAA